MRLDQALVAAGLADSRARAQALIAAGVVRVDGRRPKPAAVSRRARWRSRATRCPGCRAPAEARHALAAFGLDPAGAVALDLGASTGGFSQVLLAARRRRGLGRRRRPRPARARSVAADPRLHAIEGLNVRDLTPAHVPPPDWIVADLSFISLAKALPPALALAQPGAVLVALVKPQFEVGPGAVGKGGIVRDPAAVAEARRRRPRPSSSARAGRCSASAEPDHRRRRQRRVR